MKSILDIGNRSRHIQQHPVGMSASNRQAVGLGEAAESLIILSIRPKRS